MRLLRGKYGELCSRQRFRKNISWFIIFFMKLFTSTKQLFHKGTPEKLKSNLFRKILAESVDCLDHRCSSAVRGNKPAEADQMMIYVNGITTTRWSDRSRASVPVASLLISQLIWPRFLTLAYVASVKADRVFRSRAIRNQRIPMRIESFNYFFT